MNDPTAKIIADNYFASNRNEAAISLTEEAIIADNYFASNRNSNTQQKKGRMIIADNYFASNRNISMRTGISMQL